MGEVKPCPFCGSDDLHAFDHNDGEPSFGFQCARCWMTSSQRGTREEVVTAWNTRTPSEAVLVEALEKLLTLCEAADEAYDLPDTVTGDAMFKARQALAAAKGERV
jgi:Lar family restriction alleviation protein